MTQPYNHNLDPTQRLVYEARPQDMMLWSKQYPFGNTATFNQELETYLPANVFQQNGELILEGRNIGGGNNTVGSGKYTSGMVASYNCLSLLYGYIEASIKMPSGYGVWPAFWMLYTSYNANNEIDINEIFESPTSLNTGVHFPTNAHDGGATTVANMSSGYHVYAVDWQPAYIQWYMDGAPIRRITTGGEIPSQLMYILLNVAISGVAVNNDIPNDNQFPIDMHVQYVRIWQGSSSQYQLVRTSSQNYANYLTTLKLDGASNYFPLTETSGVVAHDVIGGTIGSIVSGVALNQPHILGNGSPSMAFDGSTGYITLPASIKPDGLFAWSAEFWFAYPASAHHGGRALDNAHTDSVNQGFQFNMDSITGGLASLATSGKTSNLYWSTAYSTETPYHHVLTYDGVHAYLYLNGAQVGNDTIAGAIVASTFPINIGRGAYANDYFQGRIGHVAFYPLALTPAQVSSHYSSGLLAVTGPANLALSDSSPSNVTVTDTAVS